MHLEPDLLPMTAITDAVQPRSCKLFVEGQEDSKVERVLVVERLSGNRVDESFFIFQGVPNPLRSTTQSV